MRGRVKGTKMRREMTIEQALVWAYRDQQVHRAAPVERPRGAGAIDLVGASAGGGGGSVKHHDDALTIHGAVLRLPAEQRAAVIEHAKTAGRPWPVKTGRARYYPELGWKQPRAGRGREAVSITGAHDRREVFTPVLRHDPCAIRERAMSLFVVWRAGLKALRDGFLRDAKALKSIEILPDLPARLRR